MADIPGNTSTKSVISGTGTYKGTLELNTDSDWWRVSLTGGQTYMFKVTGDGSANSLDDARLYIRDSLGNSIDYVSDGNTIAFTPPANGVYYIDVVDTDTYDNAGEGNYVITATMTDKVKNNNTTTAVISGTGNTTGSLGENTDSDWYKVNLVAGRSYSFQLVGDGSINALNEGRLALRDANGNQIDYVSDGYYLSFTAATSGAYYLDVRDPNPYDGAAEGSFVLKSQMSDTIVANSSTKAVIQAGHELRSTIDAAQDQDWFRLDTKTGVTYELSLSGVGADPISENKLTLRDAQGNQIDYEFGSKGGAALITFKATSNGPYYLEVRSDSIYDVDMGSYLLGVRSNARTVVGSTGNDTLSGMDNDNVIYASNGDDVLNGNGGNDTLIGGSGNDTLKGGAGFDIADYSGTTAVKVDLNKTSAQVTGKGTDVLSSIEGVTGGSANDVLTGNAGANLLNGGAGHDSLLGGSGNDTLVGGLGNDTINGGSGLDSLQFDGSAGRKVDLRITTSQDTGEGRDLITGVENVIGGAGNDTIKGSESANTLAGGAGNDLLYGNGGDDRMLGGAGNDIINGGAGIDTLVFATSSRVKVNLSVTTAQATGEGTDTITNIENIESGAGNDLLTGNKLANRLTGGAGNDILDGDAGNDRLLGGAGNDRLRGGDGNDLLTGDAGADTFLFYAGDDTDRITDFEQGVDLIEIRSGADAYSDLTITQVGADTHVIFGDTKIVLSDTSQWSMGASDFVFS